jgi:hypothetical protein
MSAPKKSSRGKSKNIHDLHPGSSAEDAAKLSGKGDFGVHADDVAARAYASQNTKRADPGSTQPSANEELRGERTAGAGGDDAGPGSGSGGDLDTDIVGVGTHGSGISASGRTHTGPGADDSDGTSREMASGGPARGDNQTNVGKVGGSKDVKGSTVLQPDARTVGGTGADDASNAESDIDSSFVGEISSAEADGRDEAGE